MADAVVADAVAADAVVADAVAADAVVFEGITLAPTPLAALPQSVVEISGSLSLVPLAFRTPRNMSRALYAVTYAGKPTTPYAVQATVGSGAFSTVHRIAPVEGDGPPLAIKAYNRLVTDSGGQYIALERALIASPNVAGPTGPMIAAMLAKSPLPHDDLLMPYCRHTLKDIVSLAPPQPPAVIEAVAAALFRMQSDLIARAGLIHTDASTSNVLCIPLGGNRVEFRFADYGGLHRIGDPPQDDGSAVPGCFTFGLPEHGYKPFAHIRSAHEARLAARYLAAATAAATYMRKRTGPLYDAITHLGSRRVIEAERSNKHDALRRRLRTDGCATVARWLDPDPTARTDGGHP